MIQTTVAPPFLFRMIELKSSYIFEKKKIIFWYKDNILRLRCNFVQRGGVSTRSGVSLQNRFNKLLQADVNKFIGYLHSALHEPHSGWVMEDYVSNAKKIPGEKP